MRHRMLAIVAILIVAFASFVSPWVPLQAFGAFVLMAAGGIMVVLVLFAAIMLARGALFGRNTDRGHRFN